MPASETGRGLTPGDPHDLERFVAAQDRSGTYDAAIAELRRGRKTSHWMWFVFPQLAGLGQSAMARTYGIASLAQARAYLAHPVLGPRLIESARVLTELSGLTAQEIFGSLDAIKLRSSMTLFALAAPGQPLFGQVLDDYFGAARDDVTVRRLGLEK